MFVLGDCNELKLENFYRAFELSNTVSFPTTKGGTSLDIIATNMTKYYRSPTDSLTLGGCYYFSIELNPLNSMKITYTTKEITSQPITDTSLFKFGNWIIQESWIDVPNASTANSKAESLQSSLLEKFCSYFPKRKTKSFSTDHLYISKDV